MKTTAVVTIASENYFAQVDTLLESLLQTNPGWDRYFAIADEPDDDLKRALTRTDTKLITMGEIDLPDINDMKFRYDIMELNTAIKPFVLKKLLKKYDRVVYLDPDIVVYKSMELVNKAFDDGYEFVITPHLTGYWEEDGRQPTEPDILLSGTYNFGFFGIARSKNSSKVLNWWSNKLEKLCIVNHAGGIFVDQKWMDLLPGRHDKVFILRDAGYNVAYWNLSHRKATLKHGEYCFNGKPLVFFHFSGFNPNNPEIISKHQSRYNMKQIGVASDLFRKYVLNVKKNGYDQWRIKRYAYAVFNDGRDILDVYRKLYRERVEVHNRIGKTNPFECASLFYDDKQWLEPILMDFVLSHHSLGKKFTDMPRALWIEWYKNTLLKEYQLDTDWTNFAVAMYTNRLSQFNNEIVNNADPVSPVLQDGVNLIGYIRSEMGIGEGARQRANELMLTDLKWSAYDWEVNNSSRQNDHTWDKKIDNTIKYNVSVFRINADQMMLAKEHLPEVCWSGYRIGIWDWELPNFPKEWFSAFDLVDEVWTSTRFIQESIQKVSPVPVFLIPQGLHRDETQMKYDRKYFSLPEDTFLFLNFFDAFSFSSRKNPFAVIKAFQQAFKQDDLSVGLVLKINNATDDSDEIKKLRKMVSKNKNIYVFAKVLDREEMDGLINCCDVSVSLHRSEGLGLLCMESMYYGKPVIATNWSGNTDFMNENNSCLVNYKLIPATDYYMSKLGDGQVWAEADINDASRYMLKLFKDRDFYDRIAKNASNDIRTNFSTQACAAKMEKRIKEILSNKDNWKNTRSGVMQTSVPTSYDYTFDGDIDTLNKYQTFRYYRDDLGKRHCTYVVKKAIRKILGFLFVPLSMEQTNYNISARRIATNLINKLYDQQSHLNATQSVIEGLKNNVNSLDQKVEQLERKIDGCSLTNSVMAITQKEFKNEFEKANEKLLMENKENTSLYLQTSGSKYNAIYQRLSNIDKTLSRQSEKHGSSVATDLFKEFVENKWALIDKIYQEPQSLECNVCGELIDTKNAEKMVSNDIFGGGKLVRYKCPKCGAIVGPSKMWDLDESELAEEYKIHYMIYDEGETTSAEVEAFMSLKPEKGKKYLNFGCGSWNTTIEKLRADGYDVYGYDPYAPSDSEYIIKDIEQLKKMKFDGIFSHDLLEHLRYPVATFEIFKSLLKKGGRMAHSTACYKYVYEYDRFHLVFYTGEALKYLCKRTGFRLVEKNENDDQLKYNYIYELK